MLNHISVALFFLSALAWAGGTSSGDAPRDGMRMGTWSSGNKDFFGTAYESYDSHLAYSDVSSTAPISKVWFTQSRGALTEVYWPSLDRPQVKDSQLMVSDGHSFLWKEGDQAPLKVEWLSEGVPAYRTVHEDPRGRFRIERITFTDPSRPVLLQKIKIVSFVAGLRFYYLHNPSVANSPLGDTAHVETLGPRAGLYSSQGDEAQGLFFSVPLKQASAGFEGANDGATDLGSDFKMDSHYEWAREGNVVTTAQLDIPESAGTVDLSMALVFGKDFEGLHAQAAVSMASIETALASYVRQWRSYQSSVRDLSAASLDGGLLFRRSVALLKSMEDKTSEGAFIASPTIPWGNHHPDDAIESDVHGRVGGYHLVWPRDLYQMSTTFLALGDAASSAASLKYLRSIQFGLRDGEWVFDFRRAPRDGSFTQNCWIDGTPYWPSLQMDETAFPVLLAYRLWKAHVIRLEDFWDMVVRASDFIVRMGPWSAQERWEEAAGASPSSIAAQIAALAAASEMAEARGDRARADRYRKTSDDWSWKKDDNVDTWTFTTSGALGNGHYYERLEGAARSDQRWDPNDEESLQISNPGGALLREKDVIDGGFLELVRLGVRSALDSHILETLPEYDRYLRVDTRKGPAFFRYRGDRYNYDELTGQNTAGMLWPLLAGERATYEFQRVVESGGSTAEADRALLPYLSAMEHFATSTGMIPEQVWSEGSREGLPTGAASPLGWAHGEYIKLLQTRLNQKSFDVVESLHQRSLWRHIQKISGSSQKTESRKNSKAK